MMHSVYKLYSWRRILVTVMYIDLIKMDCPKRKETQDQRCSTQDDSTFKYPHSGILATKKTKLQYVDDGVSPSNFSYGNLQWLPNHRSRGIERKYCRKACWSPRGVEVNKVHPPCPPSRNIQAAGQMAESLDSRNQGRFNWGTSPSPKITFRKSECGIQSR